MASTLTAAELPQHERGSSAVPAPGSLTARMVRLAGTLRALAMNLPDDLDDVALIGVGRGLDALDGALSQACAAAGLARRSSVPAPVQATEYALGNREVG